MAEWLASLGFRSQGPEFESCVCHCKSMLNCLKPWWPSPLDSSASLKPNAKEVL